jgi:membrane protein DedA with SNARE-associated domain
VTPQILLIALGTLVSEDLTCIATGVLVSQHRLGFFEGVLACLLGIFVGDVLLFFSGRFLGRRALDWPPLARLVPESKMDEASRWLSERALRTILVSRFTPGLRLPAYFAAGLLRTRLTRFSGYFLLAASLWTPLLVGATVLFGEKVLRAAVLGPGPLAFALVFASAACAHHLIRSAFARGRM